MMNFAKGGKLRLHSKLLDDKGKSCILALDVYNILSLELIQTNEWQNEDSRILEGTFSKRRQLCVDIQTSNLLKSDSLQAAMAGYEVEELPEEFPIALLWDEPPISSAICKMLGRLIGELKIVGLNEEYSLHAVSFTLSKGTLAFSATPGQSGNIYLNTASASLEMRIEDFMRLATQWEMKPDLVFLAKRGSVCFRQLDNQEWKDLENVVMETENIVLEAPVPSIVMQEQEEGGEMGEIGETGEEEETAVPGQAEDEIQPHPIPEYQWNTWTCHNCGQSNEEQNRQCRFCGVGPLEAEEPVDSAPEPASFKHRVEKFDADEPMQKIWQCKQCGRDNLEGKNTCEGCRRPNAVAAPAQATQLEEKKPTGWECSYCTLINKDYDRICAACAKTRSDLLPPSPPAEENTPRGYWKCDPCGYAANTAADIRCFKCKALKGAKGATPATKGTTPVKTDEKWECVECGEENNSWSQKCLGCFAPRGGAKPAAVAEEEVWACSECNTENPQRKSYCVKCYSGKPRKDPVRLDPSDDFLEEPRQPAKPARIPEPAKLPESAKPPEPNQWKCSKCGTLNREGSRLCSKCVASRPVRDEQMEVDGWTCAKCATKNRSSDRLCGTCYATKTSQRPATEKVQRQEVEKVGNYESWNCPSCKTLNLHYDAICRKCGSTKEAPREQVKEPAAPPKPAAASDNYWSCSSCSAKNYKGDDRCYRCKKGKDRNIDVEPAEDKRWTCDQCQAKNAESATYCTKCISTRSPEKRDTAWMCKYCSRKNSSPGSRCQHCFKRNPDPADEPVSQAKTCSQCGKRLFGEGPMCSTCELASATWRCKKCGQTNKGDTRDCKYCVAEPEGRKSTKCRTCGKAIVLAGEEYCAACRPRTVARTWNCASCGIANTSYFCKGCRKPKPI